VTAFTEAAHPQVSFFQGGPKPDPGRIKFNHKLHLTPGIVRAAGAPPWTVARIAERDRDRYRDGADDAAPATLRCESCHVLDRGDLKLADGTPGGSLRPVRSAGATYLPIAYEQHCAGCHALDVNREPTRSPGPKGRR